LDVTIIRAVVYTLGVIASLCIGGMAFGHSGQEVVQAYSIITTACVTALVGILAAQRNGKPSEPPPAK
jgi:hypothetical protein